MSETVDELKSLYQEVIIDHGRRPRNKRVMEACSCQARGKNPLCGDTLVVFLKTEQDQIIDICFEGQGCAISMASASLMTETIQGKSVAQAQACFAAFHAFITSPEAPEQTQLEGLGKLQILSGVRDYPARVKCATLAWHTLAHALEQNTACATTE